MWFIFGFDLFLLALLIPFFGWHLSMVLKNETSIETSTRRSEQFNIGWHANLRQVRPPVAPSTVARPLLDRYSLRAHSHRGAAAAAAGPHRAGKAHRSPWDSFGAHWMAAGVRQERVDVAAAVLLRRPRGRWFAMADQDGEGAGDGARER